MIPEPGDADREVTVTKTFHVQTDDELTDKELKQIEADDQAIQTILLSLPEDIYAVVDSCETAQEIWLQVQQMMKGSDIGIQKKKAKLFNEWERENDHLKAIYKNLFDSMSVSRAQTKTIITSLQNELQSNIYKNAKLRTQLFKKASDQNDNTQDTSANTKFAKQPIVENLPKAGKINALSNPVTSNSVPTPHELKGVNNDKVIAPGMFRINSSKTSREEKHVPNTVSASARTKPITVSQPHVITKKDVNSDLNGLSSTGVDNTKTRRPQPRSNTKNDRVPFASKSSRSQNKEAKVEEHHRNLLLYKNNKHISSACNNIKIDSQDVISKVVCAMCKKCLIFVNHEKCLSKNVNGKNSCRKNQKAKVSVKEIQKKYQPKVAKPKKVGTRESLATPKPRKPRLLLRWSPTGRLFDQEGKLAASSNYESQYDCSNGDNACTSKAIEPKIKRFPNSTSLLDRNDLVAGLLKFKYHKEHLFPSCEQGKSKRASPPPKHVPNSRQRLHLLHMDLCGPMRIASINGKRYVLVIVDDYSRYTWVHFLRSKDEAPEVIIKFLKRISVLLQQMQIVRGNGGNQFRQYAGHNAGQNAGNITGYNDVIGNQAGIQLQAEEYDLMAAAIDLDEIEKVNANCILMANLQQASTSGTQTDKAPVYDLDGSAEVHEYENFYDNEIFNMFTQEEQFTELLKPIPESHQVSQNDNYIISEVTSMEQSGEIVEQHPTNFEETRALYD
nr:ribonuclease H-like domain-containing protein [Tanacetum cinerariifolium]